MTHELVHTALASLPDDRRWMEEGNATYIEPIARTQAGELSANLLASFGFSLGFSFSLFRSQRPYRIGAHRAKCRKIQSDQ
jgi:hypothetical protein